MLCFYKTSWLCNSEDVRAVVHDVSSGGITMKQKRKTLLLLIINKIINEVEVPFRSFSLKFGSGSN
jgi:hypothetical protein